MRCPECGCDNTETDHFCRACGVRLELVCAQCGAEASPDDRFCAQCGARLEPESPPVPEPLIDGERKQVTVLFCDLSGYTALSEKLDPEEVKEIMSRIFGETARVVAKYDAHIDKFIGDAVMALFGVPRVHEDDPVRAIRAAMEIHELVERMSPQFEAKIGGRLAMHSGISTGLVVTGEIDLERGTETVLGNAINIASRLTGLALPRQILVSEETYEQAERYFNFRSLGPTRIRGRQVPIGTHEVLSAREKPVSVHRLSGLRADLIGRKTELARLKEAANALDQGRGSIVSICGEAGTGKSRLVREFRDRLDLRTIQWREGHCYAYAQNIPYAPLIDLLNRAWGIEEGDLPEALRDKVASNIALLGGREDIVPYVGSLLGLDTPETESGDPQFWKSQLFEAVRTILGALTLQGPTVIFLEDVHWADPSFVELIRAVLTETAYPAVFLCTYRPPFRLFAGHQLEGVAGAYHEIELGDLSSSEAEDMMESLLGTERIPVELRHFVQDRVEGNPFYLEEVVNSLIESDALVPDDDGWRFARPLRDFDIPLTVNGVISARIDRLELEMKRTLQEASVIGRTFFYEILHKVTELQSRLDQCLTVLERLDLVRTRAIAPDLEYIFKHVLTQEVAYNSLLRTERQRIHEKIGLVMEELFRDRLSEFYETLAYHFKQSDRLHKAVDYLIRSGDKSLKRYAVEESHKYFGEAFDLLNEKTPRAAAEDALLVDLVVKWASVYYYRGDFRALVDMLRAHESLAASVEDPVKLGMLYVWLGIAYYHRALFPEAHDCLLEALAIGERVGSMKVIGHASSWIANTCTDIGRLDDALEHGRKAREISEQLPHDHFLHYISLNSLGYTYWARGQRKKTHEMGVALVDFGERQSNTRSLVSGHWITGLGYLADDDLAAATDCFVRALAVSSDPYLSQFPRLFLSLCHVYSGRLDEAGAALDEVLEFSERFGADVIGIPAQALLGVVLLSKGDLNRGMKMIQDGRNRWLESECAWGYVNLEYVLGSVYLQIVEGASPLRLSSLAKNVGFLIKNVPFAAKKSEACFNNAIENAAAIGALGIVAQSYLGLGRLHKLTGDTSQARDCVSQSIESLRACEADAYLKRAKETLSSLQ